MKRNLYTKEEIILCTYIARFGRSEFTESDIHKLKERSIDSIKMKVQNIASMLEENDFGTSPEVSPLTGKPNGEKGRTTNWNIVKTLTDFNKVELYNQCEKII